MSDKIRLNMKARPFRQATDQQLDDLLIQANQLNPSRRKRRNQMLTRAGFNRVPRGGKRRELLVKMIKQERDEREETSIEWVVDVNDVEIKIYWSKKGQSRIFTERFNKVTGVKVRTRERGIAAHRLALRDELTDPEYNPIFKVIKENETRYTSATLQSITFGSVNIVSQSTLLTIVNEDFNDIVLDDVLNQFGNMVINSNVVKSLSHHRFTMPYKIINIDPVYQKLNCGIACLKTKYQNQRGFKKFMADDDKLARIAGYKDMQDITDNYLTINGLLSIVKHMQVSCFIIDSDGNILAKHISMEHAPTLYLAYDHQHVELIDNSDPVCSSVSNQRKSKIVMEHKTGFNDGKILSKFFREPEFCYTELTNEMIESLNGVYYFDDLDAIYLHLLRNNLTKPKFIKYKNLRMISFRFGQNVLFTNNKYYENGLKLAKALNIKYTGQGIHSILAEKNGLKERLKSDLLNEDLREIFYNWNSNEQYFLLHHRKDTFGIDLKRCYQNAMTIDNEEPYCIFNGLSEIIPTKTLDGTGIYYLEFKNKLKEAKLFFRKTKGWFYRHIVEYIKSCGFKVEIKYMVKPERTENADVFVEYIKELYQYLDENDAKQYARIFTGILRKYRFEHDVHSKTGTYRDVLNFISNYRTHYHKTRRLTDKDDELDSWNAVVFKMEKDDVNTLPIGEQILQNSCRSLHRIYRQSGLEIMDLVAINCDEIVVCNYKRKDVEERLKDATNCHIVDKDPYRRWARDASLFELEQFRKLDSEKSFEYKPRNYELLSEDNHTRDELTKKLREMVNRGESCLIHGIAGTGKSWLIREIFGEESKCSFMNLSALNIEGVTINRLYGINLEGQIKRSAQKDYEHNRCIVFDEIGQCPYSIQRIIYIMKRIYPNVPLYMFGDFNQCKPVEKKVRDYENSLMFKELVDFNRIELTRPYRQEDKSIVDRYGEILSGKFKPTYQISEQLTTTKVNLVVTNKKRKQINQYVNTFFKFKQDHLRVEIEVEDGDPRQSFCLYPELPLIAFKRFEHEDEEFFNCERFEVVSYDQSNVTMKSLYKDKEVTVPLEKVKSNCVMAYAITINRAQGLTIDRPYTIHEWEHRINDESKRYTAYSRCRDESLISIRRD